MSNLVGVLYLFFKPSTARVAEDFEKVLTVREVSRLIVGKVALYLLHVLYLRIQTSDAQLIKNFLMVWSAYFCVFGDFYIVDPLAREQRLGACLYLADESYINKGVNKKARYSYPRCIYWGWACSTGS